MQESVGMSDSGNHWKSQRSWFFYRTIVISFFCTLFLLTSGDQPPVLMRTKCYTCVCLSVKSLQLCLTLYNPVACGQAPLSMRFSRQKYWSGWEWDRSLNPAGFRIFPTQGSNWHLFTSTCIGRQIGDSVVKKKICLQYRRCRNPGLIPWIGRSPGGENGNPLQCFWLENPMDRGLQTVGLQSRELSNRLSFFFPFATSATWEAHGFHCDCKPEESQQPIIA